MNSNSGKRISSGPVVLLVWDGFGVSKRKSGNAVYGSKMPTWRKLWKQYPHAQLRADGSAVGLPPDEVGNSEAGHETIGAGRPILSDKVIINNAIKSGSFNKNPAFAKAVAHAKKNKSTLHLIGMLANHQSAHADFGHLIALCKLVKSLKAPKVALHLFTDGRDAAPHHSIKLLEDLEKAMCPNVRIATIIGRFYAMDRNRNWKRTEVAYKAMVNGVGVKANSPAEAIEQAYDSGVSDEFIPPTVITNKDQKPITVKDNDAVIFWNLRSDRARQMVKPFIQESFNKKNKNSFERKHRLKNLLFVTMTEFGRQIDDAIAAYPHHETSGTIVEALRSYKQVYIAESEKYAHVTYFLNGGYDTPRFHESRVRIPSSKVVTFDQNPKMQAEQIAKKIIESIKKDFDFICANFANADMVAHTGNYKATVKACEALDKTLKRIWQAVEKAEGTLIVTADHGNAEEVLDRSGSIDTHHNANPVPILLLNKKLKNKRLHKGTLADIAPTVLTLLGAPIPKEMTGDKLVA